MSAPDQAAPAVVPEAALLGRTCAVAGRLQRDMRGWAEEYPSLFDAKPFDPALYSTLALASAFSGPWLSAAELRIANRACLWCFGLDWLVDYAAGSPREVRELVRRCRAVVDGEAPAPGDDLTRFLADIRDELAAAPAFAALGAAWREEFARMATAMTREAEWKAAGVVPSYAEYLGNADNLGFSFVFVSHWIATSGTAEVTGTGDVRRAAQAVQRVIRLLNDLGTYERDLAWGDLNALLLGVTREEVTAQVAELAARARDLLAPLRPANREAADYMERQMDFCAGFYQVSDYWGSM
ncbi:hypothetical protein HNP84_006232 [Thermocatellispora tengchongensis]|uniref:Terpene synthase n=1 Tax=Thermocatellispora tengchongensis TaxID=1073253 RepID=A0A840PKA5_9ACTN|nr:terpene synthase family protein [Thermocatellispora tengchongensis]MBB5136485.1 hypothetical protein [Thermocatellispora tengchongensis]